MGNRFTFIHCADLHLGSRFKGITDDDPELGRRMRSSPMESFSRIIDIAMERDVDFMVVSGDLYDEANTLPSIRLGLSEQLRRLGRPVFVARGNHDSVTSWTDAIPYPENVYEFPIVPMSVGMNVRGQRVEVVGASFQGRYEGRNLPSLMKGRQGFFTIACVHCDVDPPSGSSEYSPCRSEDLRGRDIDYWALGHIHKRTVVMESPLAVYPGNIQGRSIKETGEKGAYIITVEDGRIASYEFVPTQSIIWEEVDVDITGMSMQGLLSVLEERIPRGSVVRLNVHGSGELDSPLRSERDDVVRTVQSRCGCTVCDISVDTTSALDLGSVMGMRDMRGKVVEAGMQLARDRASLIDAICENNVASENRTFFESLDDDELSAIVDSAVRRIVSSMEVGR